MCKKIITITSGHTIVKIDDVRHISNFSSGITGAKIAENFLYNGYYVNFLCAKNSVKPFIRNLSINHNFDFNKEIERMKNNFNILNKLKNNLNIQEFITYDDYLNNITSVAKNSDVIILCAAVSDYYIQSVKGKISSNREVLNLKLKKTKKIIHHIKEFNPNIIQVGFKLLIDSNYEEMKKIGIKNFYLHNSDILVVNSLNSKTMKPKLTMMILKNTSYILDRLELENRLLKEVESILYN